MGASNRYKYGTYKWSELSSIKALLFQGTSRIVRLQDYPPLKMVSFEALLKFHRNRFEGKTCTQFPPLEDWVDVLQVAKVMGDGRYLGFVAEYLKVDRRCVDSSHTRQELKKVLRDRLRLKKVVPRLIYSCGCGICKDDVEGDKGERALCCGRYYHKACIKRKSVCHNCTETWRPQSCWICLRKIDFDELNPLRSYAEIKTNRTLCCSADIHFQCHGELKSKPCLSCGIPLNDKGYSPVINTTMQFASVVMSTRRNELSRRQSTK